MSEKKTYEDATLYDCCDNEEYTHETVEEAIAERVECWLELGSDVAKLIVEHGPITVMGYVRDTIPENWAANESNLIVESIVETFCDEYGDPNGDYESFAPATLKSAQLEIEKILRELIADAAVWSCTRCGEREYSVAEVAAMMCVALPDWFEEE